MKGQQVSSKMNLLNGGLLFIRFPESDRYQFTEKRHSSLSDIFCIKALSWYIRGLKCDLISLVSMDKPMRTSNLSLSVGSACAKPFFLITILFTGAVSKESLIEAN